jgi:hypothetical protein
MIYPWTTILVFWWWGIGSSVYLAACCGLIPGEVIGEWSHVGVSSQLIRRVLSWAYCMHACVAYASNIAGPGDFDVKG